MDRSATTAFAVLGALALGGVLVGIPLAEPLPASVSPWFLVPPGLLGLYVAVASTWIRDQGVYGALLGRLPTAGHVGVCALGFTLVGASVLGFAKLPSAAALEAERLGAGLERFCAEPAGERVDRELLPAVERLHTLRGALRGSARDALDVRLRDLGARCLPVVRGAIADPRGSHVSWRRLRDALGAVPELRVQPDDPVWTAAWRERVGSGGRVDRGRPVVVELGGGEQPLVDQ